MSLTQPPRADNAGHGENELRDSPDDGEHEDAAAIVVLPLSAGFHASCLAALARNLADICVKDELPGEELDVLVPGEKFPVEIPLKNEPPPCNGARQRRLAAGLEDWPEMRSMVALPLLPCGGQGGAEEKPALSPS
jgi:hypothetical protein